MDPIHNVQTEKTTQVTEDFPFHPYFNFCREWELSKVFGTEGQHKLSITRAPFRNAHGSSSGTVSALWQLIVKQISSVPATKHRGNSCYCPLLSYCQKSRQQKILLIFFLQQIKY